MNTGHFHSFLIIHSLAQSPEFNEMLTFLKSVYLEKRDIPFRLPHYILTLQLILRRENLHDSNPEDQLLRHLRDILDFSLPLDSLESYFLLRDTLSALLDSFASVPISSVFEIVARPTLYAPVAAVLLARKSSSEHLGPLVRFLFSRFDSSIPRVFAAAIFFDAQAQPEASELVSTALRVAMDPSGLIPIVRDHLRSEHELPNELGLFLMHSIMRFYAPEISLKIVVACTESAVKIIRRPAPKLRKAVGKLMSLLPLGVSAFTTEAQIATFLPALAEEVDDFESAYTQAVCRFVTARKEEPSLISVLARMLDSPRATRSVFLFAFENGLFEGHAHFLERALPTDFARPVPQTLEALAVLLGRPRELGSSVISRICHFTFQLCTREKMSAAPEIRQLLFRLIDVLIPLYPKATVAFRDAALVTFLQIRDRAILIHIAEVMAKVDLSDQELPEVADRHFIGIFTELAVRFLARPDRAPSYSHCYFLLRIFKPGAAEVCRNVCEIVDTFLPATFVHDVKQLCSERMRQTREYLIIAAALPDPAPGDINEIVGILSGLDPLPDLLFLLTFRGIAARSLDAALAKLEELANTKPPDSLFFAKKKKLHIEQITQAVLTFLPNLLQQTTFEVPQQEVLLRIIMKVFPAPDGPPELLRKAARICDNFGKLSDVEIPIDFIRKYVALPTFADGLSTIIRAIGLTPDLVETYVNSWADHLAAEPAGEKRNQSIAEFVATALEGPEIAATVLLIMIRHFDAPGGIIPIIDFVQKFIVILNDRNIELLNEEHFPAIVVGLITRCSVKEEEVRRRAFRCITALFRAADVIPDEESSEVVGEQISFQRAVERLIRLLTKTFGSSRFDEFTPRLVAFIGAGPRPLDLPHAVLIRSLFTAKGRLLLDNSFGDLKKLIDGRSTRISTLHLRLAFRELAKVSMSQFVSLILPEGLSVFKGKLVSDVVDRRNLFDKFFPEFQKFIAQTDRLFDVLRVLPILLRADPGCVHFPDLLCDTILWIGAGFESRSGAQEITDFIRALYDCVPIFPNGAVDVNFGDLSNISTTLRSIAAECTKFEPKQLLAMGKSLFSFIPTGTPATVFVTGLFFLHLVDQFTHYKDDGSIAFMRSLLTPIHTAFDVRSPDYVRFLAVTLEQSTAEKLFTSEQLTGVWKAVLVNLSDKQRNEFGRSEATALAVRLCRAVPKPVLEQEQELLLDALRGTFAALPLCPLHAKLIDVYTAVRANVDDFVDVGQPLSYVALVMMFAGKSDDLRTAAREAIDRIERGLGETTLTKAIAERTEQGALAQAALQIIRAAAPEDLDDGWIKIIGELHEELAEAQGKEAIEFRKQLVAFLLPAALTAKGKKSTTLSELLHKIYQFTVA